MVQMQLVQSSLIRFFNVKLCQKNQSRNKNSILAEDASGVASNNAQLQFVTFCSCRYAGARWSVPPASRAAVHMKSHCTFYFVPMTIAQ